MSHAHDGPVPPTSSMPIPWGGDVAPGFEPVRDAFVAGLPAFGAGGGSLAAYQRGQRVVHLWGGWARPAEPWQEDTLAVIFSCSKGLATLCLQMAHDRGLVDLDAHVADLWPGFEAAGKSAVRVRHLLSHTSGVLAPADAASFLTWAGAGWADQERIEAGLAAAAPAVPIGCTFAYQAISFGWLVNAILRRATGLTIGRFLAQEIAGPLGLDLRIGTPADVLPRVAPVRAEPVPAVPMAVSPEAAAYAARATALAHDPTTLLGRALLALDDGNVADHWESFGSAALLEPEMAGANGTATAAALAGMYDALACGGVAGGVRLVSPESIARFRTLQIQGPNALDLEADPDPATVELHQRLLGYHGSSRPPGGSGRLGPSATAFGHDGAGGQIAFADPERSIAAAFVRSEMTQDQGWSAQLLERLYACAGPG